jgi:hypothetical protein
MSFRWRPGPVRGQADRQGPDLLAADTSNIPVFRDRIRFLIKAREDRYTAIPQQAMP